MSVRKENRKSLCKDFWLNGYGKVAVVPSVNVEYGNENAKRIKAEKRYICERLCEERVRGDYHRRADRTAGEGQVYAERHL